jgi:hypothetical protein
MAVQCHVLTFGLPNLSVRMVTRFTVPHCCRTSRRAAGRASQPSSRGAGRGHHRHRATWRKALQGTHCKVLLQLLWSASVINVAHVHRARVCFCLLGIHRCASSATCCRWSTRAAACSGRFSSRSRRYLRAQKLPTPQSSGQLPAGWVVLIPPRASPLPQQP